METYTSRQRRSRRFTMMGLVGTLALSMLLLGSGCKHRRSSYRPYFVEPTPVLTEPSPSLVVPEDATVVPETVTPAFPDDFGTMRGSDVSPPSSPPPSSEPDLELDPVAPPRDEQTVPSRVESGPEITPPQSYRAPSGVRETRLTARSEPQWMVRDRVDDPSDLLQPPRADRPWRYIVIHHSAMSEGGYAQLDKAHRQAAGLKGCGYHFVIGNGTGSRDGAVEVTQRWSDQESSIHCRDAVDSAINEYGISICLVGDFNEGRPSARQLESTRQLVQYLQQRYQIPSSRVRNHGEVTANGTSSCPGKNFEQGVTAPPTLTRR